MESLPKKNNTATHSSKKLSRSPSPVLSLRKEGSPKRVSSPPSLLLKQVKVIPLNKQLKNVRASASSYSSDIQLFSTEKTPRYKHYDV